MQKRREQQPRINRSRTEKGKGLYKTLVVVVGLVLSLVGAYSSAEAQRFPPPPSVPPNIAGAQITGITFAPWGGYGVKITLDKSDPRCQEGYVLRPPRHNDVYSKEAFATLLATFMGHKAIDIWFLDNFLVGTWNDSDWGPFVCVMSLFQVRH